MQAPYKIIENSMKIVITGGLGFIGSRFVKLCKEKGHDIKIIDKASYAADLSRIDPEIGYYKKDICDVTEKDLQGFDFIVNFAAETHVDNSIENGRPFMKSNVEGVFNLLEQARKVNIKKFIQISTDEVYGDKIKGESKETDLLFPSSYYSATKTSADLLVKAANRTYNLPYIITRCCNNYGPNQHPEKFIPTVLNAIKTKSSIPVYTPGTQSREWIHVDDHCLAIYKLMLSNKVNEIYNIGTKERLTNLQLIKILARGRDYSIEMVKDRLGHDTRYALNCKKFIKTFGTISNHSITSWSKYA